MRKRQKIEVTASSSRVKGNAKKSTKPPKPAVAMTGTDFFSAGTAGAGTTGADHHDPIVDEFDPFDGGEDHMNGDSDGYL